IKRLTLWFTANYLQVNATKTQAMTLGKSQFVFQAPPYVLPHLEYCCPLLLGISKALNNNIEQTNHWAIKTLLTFAK
ncbi:unnamed protein product, partial [Pocillopora meandrina]